MRRGIAILGSSRDHVDVFSKRVILLTIADASITIIRLPDRPSDSAGEKWGHPTKFVQQMIGSPPGHAIRDMAFTQISARTDPSEGRLAPNI